MNNYNHTDINPLCPAHTSKPWGSVIPPKCICNMPNPVPMPQHDWKVPSDSASTLELKQQISDISALEAMQADMLGIKDGLNQLWRRLHDLSELRYETHQNEGCTRAKVENDLMPAVSELRNSLGNANGMILKQRDEIDLLEKRIEALEQCNIGQVDVNTNHVERIEKLEAQAQVSRNQIAVLYDWRKRMESPQQCNPESDGAIGANKTGLSFADAMQAIYDGKRVKRQHWELEHGNYWDLKCIHEIKFSFVIQAQLYASHDWEIINENE